MENLQVTATKVEEPVQVMTKDPKKVAAGKRLAEWNPNNKEKLTQMAKTQESEPKLTSSQAYGIGAVIAVGVLDLLGYWGVRLSGYVYQSRKGDTSKDAIKVTLVKSIEVQTQRQANKFEME